MVESDKSIQSASLPQVPGDFDPPKMPGLPQVQPGLPGGRMKLEEFGHNFKRPRSYNSGKYPDRVITSEPATAQISVRDRR
jgi:hypothetical protein